MARTKQTARKTLGREITTHGKIPELTENQRNAKDKVKEIEHAMGIDTHLIFNAPKQRGPSVKEINEFITKLNNYIQKNNLNIAGIEPKGKGKHDKATDIVRVLYELETLFLEELEKSEHLGKSKRLSKSRSSSSSEKSGQRSVSQSPSRKKLKPMKTIKSSLPQNCEKFNENYETLVETMGAIGGKIDEITDFYMELSNFIKTIRNNLDEDYEKYCNMVSEIGQVIKKYQ